MATFSLGTSGVTPGAPGVYINERAGNIAFGTPGGLTQGSFITGLAPQQNNNDFFPYDTQGEYDEALFRYTLQGVFDRQTINGLSFDTNQAITGLQRG